MPAPPAYGWTGSGPAPWQYPPETGAWTSGHPTQVPADQGQQAPQRRQPRLGRAGFVLLVLLVCVLLGAAATGLTILVAGDDEGPTAAEALTAAPPTLAAQLPADPDGARTVYAVAFSDDGERLAVADGGRSIDYSGQAAIRLWKLDGSGSPVEIGRQAASGPDWFGVAFAPDLNTVAVGAVNTVLLDTSNPARTILLTRPFGQHADVGQVAAFSPDGETLAIANSDGTTRLWDVADRADPKLAGEAFGGGAKALGLAFSPDGKTLAVGDADSEVHLWDVSDPTHPTGLGDSLDGHASGVWDVAFSPDGKTLATAGGDSTVRLWDVTDLARPAPVGAPLTGPVGGVLAVGFSPDGTVLVGHGSDNTVHLWNVTDRANVVALGQPLPDQWGATFSPDGSTLATVGTDNSVRLWRLR
ncbi:WD40 repeat domain-containing protein [Frankia sp. CNm7]|uniref:WD40 repeat domain-containing protein n=1 Tax=Frankia nepalensis TaxID=1836974 RepID=A0A937RFU7_9ACTN|nr:WD40 repeat domain-containing protein [Frankia nepalensis]MBL7501200.1 WD40 repeat domain-containing protein [Frankia nepalensis]MBL7514195.1 WD40 repeat domain-containing protein [Frankia nepalensis]MBL7521269.1 WD40 repeat domain-containing protein [Frankia nepalensis]MBL7631416.1 WD40 repeat domain-containing protein [Frankia nepalensis]